MATPAETIRALNTRIAEMRAQVESLTATYEEYKELAATRCVEGDVKPGYTCVGGEWVPITVPPGMPAFGEPSTIEAPEIIPGIKPPRVPLLTPELAKIPLLPGWIIRDADGNVVAGREADTIEFQEIIPGITPPRVPQLIPLLEKLPLLPGWTIRNPVGAVVAQGAPLPTVGGEAPLPPITPSDGEHWIREGAIFMEDFEPLRTFEDLNAMSSGLKDIGIKTIEMLPIWDHPSTGNHYVRWAVRNYSKLDPERGSEAELSNFIAKAHSIGLKIVPMIQTTGTFAPSPVCSGNIAPDEPVYYDKDGIGGDFYLYQIANPDKKIILKNKKGEFVCLPMGFGFAVNQDSEDVIELVEDIYKKQILSRGFDGVRLDASAINHCIEGEEIFINNKSYACIDPATEKHTPLPLYRKLREIKNPDQVFVSEFPFSGVMYSDYIWNYPYYPQYPDIDEVVDASEGYEFAPFLGHIVTNEKTSSELVDWINEQPILYDRQRQRMFRNWGLFGPPVIEFIAKNPRYNSVVMLTSTIPGIPKVTDYELFGNDEWDRAYNIVPTNLPDERREHWKKVLNIRNNNNALKYGDIKNVWKSGDNTYAYSRTYEDEQVIVVINFLDKETTSTLDLSFLDKGTVLYDELNSKEFTVDNPSNFKISVPAYGSRILALKGGWVEGEPRPMALGAGGTYYERPLEIGVEEELEL